ncbi:MAG: hypothetical protein ACRDQ5_11150 [Sciscionella sp.]
MPYKSHFQRAVPYKSHFQPNHLGTRQVGSGAPSLLGALYFAIGAVGVLLPALGAGRCADLIGTRGGRS